MDIYAFPPIAAILDAAYGALTALSAALEPLAGTAASASAVILVTLLIRALLIPVGISQAKAAWKTFIGRTPKPDYGLAPQFAVVPRE